MYLLIDGLLKTVLPAVNSDVYMLAHVNYSYDDKMKQKWGFYYDYMKFVRTNVAAGSTVLIPPQDLYPTAGNGGLDRYFLYPRILVGGDLDILTDENKYDCVMIVRGDKGDVWPKTKIFADSILFIDSKDLTTTEVHGDYDPVKVPNNSWGLIRIKKW